MTNLQNLSVEQLRRVVAIKEQIERLEAMLESIAAGGRRGPGRPPGPLSARLSANGSAIPKLGRRRRRMSAASRARIAAAQRARWAKVRGGAAKAAKGVRKKRRVNSATRARLAAIARARWARAKAAGKSAL